MSLGKVQINSNTFNDYKNSYLVITQQDLLIYNSQLDYEHEMVEGEKSTHSLRLPLSQIKSVQPNMTKKQYVNDILVGEQVLPNIFSL